MDIDFDDQLEGALIETISNILHEVPSSEPSNSQNN